jgi:hypothetical protein
MARTWEKLTQDEKIEDLRRDVLKIFAVLREFQDAIAQDQSGLKSQIETMKAWGPWINQLQQRIEKLGG